MRLLGVMFFPLKRTTDHFLYVHSMGTNCIIESSNVNFQTPLFHNEFHDIDKPEKCEVSHVEDKLSDIVEDIMYIPNLTVAFTSIIDNQN